VSTRRIVHIIETGIANTASVVSTLSQIGAHAQLTTDPDVVRTAHKVILPGVGAFGAGMKALVSAGLDSALRERIDRDQATLCICLGMQLLAKSSEESPGTSGLGILDSDVSRLPSTVRVPHFGWNTVEPERGCALLRSGDAYFANSFCVLDTPTDWTAARTTHGVRFVSALERGRTLACQFHPELSGNWGRDLLSRWLLY
jgi:imidazole glycerol-phosphate synthase subunit HisH